MYFKCTTIAVMRLICMSKEMTRYRFVSTTMPGHAWLRPSWDVCGPGVGGCVYVNVRVCALCVRTL
jgi:hypothetical protein